MKLPPSAMLEPLSEATGAMLKPLRLAETDFVKIGTKTHNDRLWLSVEPMCRQIMNSELLFDDELTDREDLLQTAEGEWTVPSSGWCSWDLEEFIKSRIPESFKLSDMHMLRRRVAPTDISVILISNCIPRNRIIFAGPKSEAFYDYLLTRFIHQNVQARLQAEFKLNGTIPDPPADFKDHPTLPLAEYQRAALQMSLGQEGLALFCEPGTGKTAVCISRIGLEAKRQRAGRMPDGEARMMRVLIIVPKQVRLNWEREISRFTTVPGKVTVMRGSKTRRLRLFAQAIRQEKDCAFTALVVGYDTLVSDLDIYSRVPWDLAITDESHYFKNGSTKRWAALRAIRSMSSRRMALTGTPIANSILDICTQLEWLMDGGSGFSSLNAFAQFHGKFETKRRGKREIRTLVGYDNIPMLKERLTRLSFSISKKEAGLQLPDKVYDYYEVEMTSKQTDFYRKLRDQLALEIQDQLAEGDQSSAIVIQHILTKLLRLQQICSGFVKWDSVVDEDTGQVITEGRIEQIDPMANPKVKAVLEMLEEKEPEQKTIIWCCFVEDILNVSQALQLHDVDHVVYYGGTTDSNRDTAVWRFNNDPACRVIVANPQTAGEGLNLLGYEPGTEMDTYCDHEIFFSQNWSLIQRAQAEDRAHRRGTKRSVRITDLVVPSTYELGESIDQVIRDRVQGKKERADSLTDITDVLTSVLSLEIA